MVPGLLPSTVSRHERTREYVCPQAARVSQRSLNQQKNGALEIREHQQSVMCRKTGGRGAKRTQIFDMGCSTSMCDLLQRSLDCRFNGHITRVPHCANVVWPDLVVEAGNEGRTAAEQFYALAA